MNHVPIDPDQDPASSSKRSPLSELSRLEFQLNQLRERLLRAPEPEPAELDDERVLNQLVKEILRSRRRREKIFGAELFGEPAWDILLELYVAEWTGKRLSVHGACCVSAVPATTALRWVVKLEKDGWIKRADDPFDRRRSWLVLTERASMALRDYFKNMSIRPA